MRCLFFYLLLCLLLPVQALANDEKPDENGIKDQDAETGAVISNADKELIADLELIELLELLENMNALASMEDTE